MDKTVIALLGGASALVMVGGAQASAAVDRVGDANGLQPARSFAELLDPIPNASGLLQADERTAGKPIEMAQYYHHHHHHHHHHYRHRHHHHHHHHYPMMMIPLPGANG